MFADILIYILVVIIIIDMILMFVYCRVMEKVDIIKREKRVKEENKKNTEKVKVNNSKSIVKRLGIWILENFLYGLMRYSLLCVGRIPSHKIRNLMYRFIFNMKITSKTVIYGDCEIRAPWNIHAGNCVISNRCLLDGRNGITIGENVVFGGGVHIWTEEHDLDDPLFRVNPQNRKPVIIEDRAWICSDSTILPGVTIGEGAVLASRACATKDCDAFGVYAGVPAKKIKERNSALEYVLNGKPHWYFY